MLACEFILFVCRFCVCVCRYKLPAVFVYFSDGSTCLLFSNVCIVMNLCVFCDGVVCFVIVLL